MITSVLHDLAFGFRLLRRQPGRTAVLILTLALGIGVNTALFTLVDTVVLRPLPYPAPEQLVRLWDRYDRGGRRHALHRWPGAHHCRRHARQLPLPAARRGGSVDPLRVVGGE